MLTVWTANTLKVIEWEKMKAKLLVAVIIVSVVISVFAQKESYLINSTAEIPYIHEKYKNRFSRTEQGMPLVVFQHLWPEARSNGFIFNTLTKEYGDSVYEFNAGNIYYTESKNEYICLYKASFIFSRADSVLVSYVVSTTITEYNTGTIIVEIKDHDKWR